MAECTAKEVADDAGGIVATWLDNLTGVAEAIAEQYPNDPSAGISAVYLLIAHLQTELDALQTCFQALGAKS